MVNKSELYRFQVKSPLLDPVIKVLLRSYTGLFENFVKISEVDLASRSKRSEKEVQRILNHLHENKIIEYIPKNNSPKVTFVVERRDEKNMLISKKTYNELRKSALEKSTAVWKYASEENECRSIILLNYFGEKTARRCGVCDFCLERNKVGVSQLEFNHIKNQLFELLEKGSQNIHELTENVDKLNKDKVLHVVQWLLEHHKLVRKPNGKLALKK